MWRRPCLRNGYVRVHTVSAGGFDFPLSCYESLTHALDNGARHWEGPDIYGESVWLRCRDISAVNRATPVGIAAWEAEETDRIEYVKVHGEDE